MPRLGVFPTQRKPALPNRNTDSFGLLGLRPQPFTRLSVAYTGVERYIAACSQFVPIGGVPARHLQLYLLMTCGHPCPEALVHIGLAFV